MQKTKSTIPTYLLEILFQLGLIGIVLIFFAYEKNRGSGDVILNIPKLVFYLNYVVAAMVINYLLLPRFLYQKKYIYFILFSLIIISGVIAIEEGVIEQIFYPETRGRSFPSLFNNLFTAMPIITILVGFKFAWDAIHQRRQLEILQSAVKESELQFLKTQINPHFLFNNLNNLYAYAIEQSPKTPKIILELSGVLRYMLYECKEATVPLKKEMEQLGNFVNLSKLQLEERGTVNFTLCDIKSGYRIAPLILSVFIENAFKHSTCSQQDNIDITIALEWDSEETLVFICENSFSLNSNTENLSNGIGLENVRKRLDLLYPEKHQLQIENTKNWFKVKLIIQLDKDSK